MVTLAIAIAFIMCSVEITSFDDTCLQCRATRHHQKAFGIELTSIHGTELSTLYQEDHPEHIHEWRIGGTFTTRSAFIHIVGDGTPAPIWHVRPSSQFDVYRRIPHEDYLKILEKFDHHKRPKELDAMMLVIALGAQQGQLIDPFTGITKPLDEQLEQAVDPTRSRPPSRKSTATVHQSLPDN